MTSLDEKETPHLWLQTFIQRHGASSGTVHLVDQQGVLRLVASANIPPTVLDVIGAIPRGKGMAGLAWDRNEPVSTCNLKTDSSGDVRPGARAVQAQAAVALPIHDAGEVSGVVGIAYVDERELSAVELATLGAEAETVPRPEI